MPGELLDPPDADVEPPPRFSQELPWSRSPMPITSTWLPQMLTGALIGTWMRLPEPTPGDPLEPPDAVVAPLPWFSQELPVTESRMPITSSWLPQTLMGALIGSWIRLPEPTPGECVVLPEAAVSACALDM